MRSWTLCSCARVLTRLAGISFKTQLLYSVVFITRYLVLFHPPSLYLISMKLFFIGSSLYILYLMKFRYRYVAYPPTAPPRC